MQIRRPSIIGIVICFYCAWQSCELVQSWMRSPYDRFGWIAFLIWFTPVIFFWLRQKQLPDPPPQGRPVYLGLGILSVFIGSIGSLHVLEHMGLAIAIVGLMPFSRLEPIWIFSALSWMPAFGWLSGRFFPECAHLARFILAIVPAGMMLYGHLRKKADGRVQ